MAKSAVAAPHQLWVFGQSYDFYLVTSSIPLSPATFDNTRHQKTQIVLHNTSGHGSAEDTITSWNQPGKVASANFVVERIFTPQAARPANTADQPDTGLVDAVRVLDEDLLAHHAGNWPLPYGLSATSIGIEISCLGEELWNLNARDEPSGIVGRHVPVATCPAPKMVDGHKFCNHGRANDDNRWLHMNTTFETISDVQALDDEQYMTLILLLRHLCIRHHIPRQFFGNSYGEIFKHWFYPPPTGYSSQFAALPQATKERLKLEQRVNVSTVNNFRGILAHRNVHRDKICPGVVDRNRLFRGISDEWWLPVQPDGLPRPYYSGPFQKPPFVAGSPTKNSYFRFTNAGKIEGSVFRNADLDALLDTKSYYRTNQVDTYYGMVETHLGGVFPMGTNKVWHGGVHFGVQNGNPCVFAAASGTIVAARLASNDVTDKQRGFGSQRFVLIKHAIFREMQADPRGLGQHINYDATPKLVFSLYMHLDPVKDITQEDDENPPWFNMWRRANAAVDIGMDGDKGKVFAPNVQVSVGDILGAAGFFRGRRMIHFEIISHHDTELLGAPWDDATQKAIDDNQDLICDVPALENFLTAHFHEKLELIDPIAAAQLLRKTKARHKSEWALTSEDQVATLIPHPDRRKVLWPHIRRFSWVAEAVAANPRLSRELGDATGMFWHYHPITFLQDLNTLVLAENRTPEDSPNYQDITVQLSDDYYLTKFVDFRGGAFVPVSVDTKTIRVTELSVTAFPYHFTRDDIACMQPGAHAPVTTPPQSTTRFSLALLALLERIRQYLNTPIKIALSHICTGHLNANLCVMNDGASAVNHNVGIAVDIQPASATAGECKKLWNAVAAIVDPYNVQDSRECGMPSQADLPDGYTGIRYTTTPAALVPLTSVPQGNVPAGEVNGFKIHVELISAAAAAAAAADNVNLRVTFVSVQVFNGQRFSGQCELEAFAQGKQVSKIPGDDAQTLQVLTLDTPVSLSLAQNDKLQFSVALAAHNPSDNDKVSLSFDRNSTPAWGIGTSPASSDGSSFILNYKVEYDQSDF